MRCLTWNLEWARPGSRRADLIRRQVEATDPDVVCYTEVIRAFAPPGPRVAAAADYGYAHDGERRKVLLWSKTPWKDVEVSGDASLPPGRFASGVTGVTGAAAYSPQAALSPSSGLTTPSPFEPTDTWR